MRVQLKSGHHQFRIPSSAPVMSNRKSESSQKLIPPSIPRRCANSRGNLPPSSSGSKRFREDDLSEANANEERRKKLKDSSKVTVEAEKAEVHSIVSKKKKLTGRSWKSHYKSMKEKTVPEKTATDKSEKLVNFQGIEEHVHSDSSSKKRRRLIKKCVQSSHDTNDSGRDILLDEEDNDKEKPNADGGRLPILSSSLDNMNNTIESSANKEHYGDQDHTPSQIKLALEDQSALSNVSIILELQKKCDMRREKLFQKQKEEIQEMQQVWKDDVSKLEVCEKWETNLNVVQKNCDKRWKKLIREQEEPINKIQQVWKDGILELESDKKLEAAIIRAIWGKCSTTIDKLHVLDGKFVKKMAEINLQKVMKIKDLEDKRNEEIDKVAVWVSDVKAGIPSKLGAKDVNPLTEQHVENIDPSTTVQGKNVVQSNNSDRATAEEVACNAPNGNPSSALNSSLKNDGGLTLSDTPISAVVEQITQPKHLGTGEIMCANLPALGERVPGDMQSPALHEDIPSELPETFANEIVEYSNPVNMSTNTPIEGFGEGDALELPHAENFGSGERIFQNLPASGESVAGEVQPLELHGDVPVELRETVANEIVDNAIPVEGFGEDLSTIHATVQEDQDVVFAQLNGHGVEVKLVDSERVDTADRTLQMWSSVVKEQVTSQMELVDSKRVDTAAPVSTSELDSAAKTLQADNKLQDQVEPAIETQSTPRIEIAVSENLNSTSPMLSSTEQQNEDALIVEIRDHLEIAVSNSGVANNVTPVQSHIDAPPVESGEQLQFMPIDAAPVSTSELVGTAKTLQADNKLQDQVEPAIETQCTPRIEIAVSENLNNTSPVLSSTEQQNEDALIVEIRDHLEIAVSNSGVANNATPVQSHIDAPPLESGEQLQFMPIDAAPISTSELVGTAKTLQADNKLQDQVEPAIETQCTPRIEIAVSENLNNTSPMLSSTEQQNEDALIVEIRDHLEIAVSNSGVAYNATPVHSHIDAPPVESGEQLQFMPIDASPSCNQLPSPELESQNHNLGRNPSGATEIEMLSHESASQLIGDLVRLLGVGPANQSSPATRVQISASFQNNVAAEVVPSTTGISYQAVQQLGGVIDLPSHQAAASISPSLLSDPFQSQLENIGKETVELERSHEDTMSGLKSGREKEIKEFLVKVQKKYELKFEDARAQFELKKNGLKRNYNKLLMNKLLADAFRSSCEIEWPTLPIMQQGFPSRSIEYHQHLVSPAGATAPNLQIANLNGQGVQQLSVPLSMRPGHVISQSYAAPSVQAAAAQYAASQQRAAAEHAASQHAEAMYRQFCPINGVHPSSNMCIPRSRGNIHSSSLHSQPFIPAAAPCIPTAALYTFQNLQQQPLPAPQWPLSFQNPQHLGYQPTLSHSHLSALALQQHQQLPGNQRSYAGATTTANQLIRR